MRAVILAGGLGTRLRPYTTVIPKPLVPVGDRPVLEHIMRSLYASGVRKLDLCVSHLGELIRVYLSQLTLARDMELAFHWEDEPLGTAGALRRVPGLNDTFIVMNGDILTTLDYRELVEFHREREAALTIAMRHTRVDVDLGVIETSDGFVTGYREKPSLDYDVSMGIYVYDERALRYLPAGSCQFPELVLRLVAAGERVAAYRANGVEWFDIGTLEEHERAAREFERARGKFNGERVLAALPAMHARAAER
jgi:NDP-sugar pyrophosphorylase family protein